MYWKTFNFTGVYHLQLGQVLCSRAFMFFQVICHQTRYAELQGLHHHLNRTFVSKSEAEKGSLSLYLTTFPVPGKQIHGLGSQRHIPLQNLVCRCDLCMSIVKIAPTIFKDTVIMHLHDTGELIVS